MRELIEEAIIYARSGSLHGFRLTSCGSYVAEQLRSEFDAYGYDLVMARRPIVRHIQFKRGIRRKSSPVSVAHALAEKPCGCVI